MHSRIIVSSSGMHNTTSASSIVVRLDREDLVMLRCIFGSSWENLDNTLPAGANVTSKQLLTFFMAWLMEFPFVSVQPENVVTDMC